MADRERLRLPVIRDDEELGVELVEDVLGSVRPVELVDMDHEQFDCDQKLTCKARSS